MLYIIHNGNDITIESLQFIVLGRLCSGDNTTMANASHSCSPVYSSLKAHTANFSVVKDHLSDGVLFLLDVNQALTTEKVKVCRGHGTAHAR